jgi:transposase
VRELAVPDGLAETVAPVLTLLDVLETQVRLLDDQVMQQVAEDPDVARLQTAPHVGPITSAAFVATLDTPTRFASGTQVASYLGLAPRDDSSGDHRGAGRISKTGSTRVRYLLVQAAWGVLRSPATQAFAMRRWAEALATRRGKRIAVVALARRLARLLFAMWRDARPFDPVAAVGRATPATVTA